MGACASYLATSQSCEQSISDAGTSTCLGNDMQTTDDFFRGYALLFCGP